MAVLIVLAVGGVYLVAWGLCRMSALQDRAEAPRELLAEQADERAADRAIADNLNV